MRRQRARKRGGRAAQIDGDFTFGVEACEIVVLDFGDIKTVADEDEFRFDRGYGIDARADDGVFAELDGFRLAVVFEGKAGAGFVEFFGDEFYRLNIAAFSGRFQSIAFELSGDIFGCFAVSFTAGVAAFQFVGREEFHVGPPARAIGGGGCECQCGPCGYEPKFFHDFSSSRRNSCSNRTGRRRACISGSPASSSRRGSTTSLPSEVREGLRLGHGNSIIIISS